MAVQSWLIKDVVLSSRTHNYVPQILTKLKNQGQF